MIKVLIVEDEPLVAKMYKTALEHGGIEVVSVLGGVSGVKKAKEIKPDLILMDIMMPGMDGLEATEKLKEDPETRDIPVVMLTNLSGVHNKELSLAKGAVEFWVKKDIKPKELGKMIMKLLQKRKSKNV